MELDAKKVETYIRELLQKYDAVKETLTPMEQRLVPKYREAQARAEKNAQDLEQLRMQAKQVEARMRSLELQLVDQQSRAQGLLEVLVSLKFEDAPGQAPAVEPTTSPTGAN